ncbi:MAG: ATPase, partial [Modestobacter sp.]|nr:ATPase [Modestobacter sp.]
ERDVQRSREALPRLLDPNGTVPDHAHGHDHGAHSHGGHTHSGHSHDHDHPDNPSRPAGGPDDEGRQVRAAKDRPGRHDDAYYGQRSAAAPATAEPAAPREVRSGQGARSFAPKRGGSARRRPV